MGHEPGHVDGECVGHDVREHGIRPGEQRAEHEQQGDGEQHTQGHRADVLQAAASRDLLPGDVTEYERQRAEHRAQRGGHERAHVARDIQQEDARALEARGREAEGEHQGRDVEGREHPGVAARERGAEQQDGEREPGGVGADGDALPAHQGGPGRDERGGAQRHVQSPWHDVEQPVAGDAEREGGAGDAQAEP